MGTKELKKPVGGNNFTKIFKNQIFIPLAALLFYPVGQIDSPQALWEAPLAMTSALYC